eukprot:s637_g27.t1
MVKNSYKKVSLHLQVSPRAMRCRVPAAVATWARRVSSGRGREKVVLWIRHGHSEANRANEVRLAALRP